MKLSAAKQEPVVAMLTRIYTEIRGIEEEYGLLAGGDDFRPRIEYFHDAIRAFTSQNPQEREPGGRLSVEFLAYDLSCLRYLHAMPLSPFKPHGEALSPHTGLVKMDQSLAVRPKRPSRQEREHLSELYQHYAVLFAALLKSFSDADFNDRIQDLNQDVEDLHVIMEQLQGVSEDKIDVAAVASAIHHLEEEGLRQALQTFVHERKFKSKDELKKMLYYLKQRSARKDREIATIESAHMNYALAQLAIFEGSKDMLKNMASQGMNLVGKFVEEAMRAASREMGR